MRFILILLFCFPAFADFYDFEEAGRVYYSQIEELLSNEELDITVDIQSIEKSSWWYQLGSSEVTYYDISFIQNGEYLIECHLKEFFSLFSMADCKSDELSMQEMRKETIYFTDLGIEF